MCSGQRIAFAVAALLVLAMCASANALERPQVSEPDASKNPRRQVAGVEIPPWLADVQASGRFDQHTSCHEGRSMLQLSLESKHHPGFLVSGGLGGLSTPSFKMWVCISAHPCLDAVAPGSFGDSMCYAAQGPAREAIFHPWGFNSELKLCHGGDGHYSGSDGSGPGFGNGTQTGSQPSGSGSGFGNGTQTGSWESGSGSGYDDGTGSDSQPAP